MTAPFRKYLCSLMSVSLLFLAGLSTAAEEAVMRAGSGGNAAALVSVPGPEIRALQNRWLPAEDSGIDKAVLTDEEKAFLGFSDPYINFYRVIITYRTVFKYLAVVLGFMLLAAAGFTIWNKTLNKELGRKTLELQKELVERKGVSEALPRNEQKLRIIIEHSPAAIAMFDNDMRYVVASRRFLLDYDLGEQNIIGRSHYQVFPEIPERWREIHRRCLAGAIEKADEDPFARADGRMDWVRWEIHPWYETTGETGGIILFSEVITDRKEAAAALRRRARELTLLNTLGTRVSRTLSVKEVISEGLRGVLAATEADVAFLLMKQGDDLHPAQTVFSAPGREFTDFPTHKLGECLCGMAVSERIAIFSADINNDTRCTWEECKRAGLQSAAALPLFSGDDVIAVLGLGSDSVRDYEAQTEFLETLAAAIALGLQNASLFERTRRHESEMRDEVRKRTGELEDARKALLNMLEDVSEAKDQLEKANQSLQELDRLKSMFIASMSHELRTPLNSIIGFTGILLQGLAGELNDEQQDQLGRVSRAGKHLLSLITDVIDVSKIEAGKIDIHIRKCDLGELINEAATSLKPEADAKGLSLKIDVPGAISLETDRRRLLQCVINLLSNAVKYTERGAVTVTARQVDHRIEIRVADTGIGIAEKDLPLLFNSFARLESRLKARTQGTGLGLYLTKKIATELLGGEVFAHSRQGEGSVFVVKIPELKMTKGALHATRFDHRRQP